MIVAAFFLGYMCSGMIKQMCGKRLVEGVVVSDSECTTNGYLDTAKTQEHEKSCNHNKECLPYQNSPDVLDEILKCNVPYCDPSFARELGFEGSGSCKTNDVN